MRNANSRLGTAARARPRPSRRGVRRLRKNGGLAGRLPPDSAVQVGFEGTRLGVQSDLLGSPNVKVSVFFPFLDSVE
jgi:hypothetical protein